MTEPAGALVHDPPEHDPSWPEGSRWWPNADLDECDPEPEWVRSASEAAWRELLLEAAVAPAGLPAAQALAQCDVDGIGDPAVLLAGIMATHRLINHYSALQQRYLAAFARPGVAVPLAELVQSTVAPAAADPGAPLPPRDLPSDLPVDADGEVDHRPLLSRPEWRPALEFAAARLASAEVGCALGLAPITARLRTERALDFTDALPATLAAWQSGDVDGYRAQIIAERTAVLPREQRRAVEALVLPYARSRTGSALRGLTDRAVIGADPDAAARRRSTARAGRGVQVAREADDMATVHAYLTAPDALLVHGVLDSQATALTAAGLAAGRGSSQLRADVLVDLFRSLAQCGQASLGGVAPADRAPALADRAPAPAAAAPPPPAARHGVRSGSASTGQPVALNVYLTLADLAALSSQAGELAGYGAITAETARALARSAESVRAIVLSGPCGSRLDAGRSVYRPPAATADYVTARDRHCQFPGCRARPERCDIDHRHEFQPSTAHPPGHTGSTCPCNLDLLCRFHHRVKTFTGWRAEPAERRFVDRELVEREPVEREPVEREPVEREPAERERLERGPADHGSAEGPSEPNARLVWTSPLGNRYLCHADPPLLPAPSRSAARSPSPAAGEPVSAARSPDPPPLRQVPHQHNG